MLFKTRAVAISYIRFRESSIIARFFTETFGLQSFVINGVRSTKSKTAPGFFQPLSLLDVVQYHDEKKDLHRLHEIKTAHPFCSISIQPVKSAMAIFAAEVLGKSVKEGQHNQPLFDLIWDWAVALDARTEGFETEHIRLLWEMMTPLGIIPEQWTEILKDKHQNSSSQEQIAFLQWITQQTGLAPKTSNHAKQEVLDSLLRYTATHLEGMGTVQSLQVLREVFR